MFQYDPTTETSDEIEMSTNEEDYTSEILTDKSTKTDHSNENVDCSVDTRIVTNSTHEIKTETVRCTNGTNYEKISENEINYTNTESTEFTEDITCTEICSNGNEDASNESSTMQTTEETFMDASCAVYTSTHTNETHKIVTETTKCSNGTEYEKITIAKLKTDSPTTEPIEENLTDTTCSVYTSTLTNDTHKTRIETTKCTNGTEYDEVHTKEINR